MPITIPQVLRPVRWPRPTRSTLVLGGLVVALGLSTHWYRVNISPSVPLGLYRLTALPQPLERGTLVLLPVPPEMRPWLSRWHPLLKPVAAITGDQVCIADGSLWIRGEDYGAVYPVAHGLVLPQLMGCFAVAESDVFLASKAPQSVDARYFGPTHITTLTAQAVPVLIWR